MTSPSERIHFRASATQVLNDPALSENFKGAMHYLRENRGLHFTDAAEFRQLQQQGKSIRQRALSKLPDLLEQLESKLTENGIQVHWAETPAEANQAIINICRAHRARLVVKGKSMVTEEIGLNHALEQQGIEQQGIEAVETDMGEFIVQLAGETPSHIIMPAIHKTKEDIARLFHEKLQDTPYTDDVDTLIQTGRKILREKFEQADVGISGVNFAVAETGTLVLVENEGNGRMSTTVPPVHIAVTGIEKVVELLADVPPLLHLLTRSATGQIITTYINMISSPRQAGEQDGPKEVHLVLLDNGRSQAYANDMTRQTLQCIRCGACMNHCPIYSRVGGHAYQTVYPGPIGKILSPHLLGLEKTQDLPSASTLCGACEEVCPVGIEIPTVLRYWRERAASKESTTESPSVKGRNLTERLFWRVWAKLNTHPKLYRLFLMGISRFRHILPTGLGSWSRYRKPPVIARRSLHELMHDRKTKNEAGKNSKESPL